MTREEAIRALGLMEHVESIVATYEPGERRNDTTVRELKEACCVAVSALRAQQGPLDRSRWEGCECCKPELYKHVGFNKDGMYFSARIPDTDKFRYCPICGHPLTEEAWAEVET